MPSTTTTPVSVRITKAQAAWLRRQTASGVVDRSTLIRQALQAAMDRSA